MMVEDRRFEPTSPLFGASVGNDPVEISRLPVLSQGVVCVILRLAVFVQCRLVTDRQIDRQTDRQTDGRADGRTDRRTDTR